IKSPVLYRLSYRPEDQGEGLGAWGLGSEQAVSPNPWPQTRGPCVKGAHDTETCAADHRIIRAEKIFSGNSASDPAGRRRESLRCAADTHRTCGTRDRSRRPDSTTPSAHSPPRAPCRAE